MSSEPVFPNYMPVEDYLEFDGYRDIRYEYVGGYLYAMVGASRRHNLIVSGISARLWQAAQGTTCQVFSSAMRLRVASDVYYYPDIVVTCRADDVAEHYIEHPCLIVEVLSPATQSRDRGEKLLAYRQIDALKTFLRDRGIQTMVHYPYAIHNLPAYRHLGYHPDDFPVANRLPHELLSLPIYPEITDEQVRYVSATIRDFYETPQQKNQ